MGVRVWGRKLGNWYTAILSGVPVVFAPAATIEYQPGGAPAAYTVNGSVATTALPAASITVPGSVTPTTITTLTLVPTITGTAVPVTFAQPFKQGDVPPGASVEVLGKTTQFDAKATYADGSVRHAVITAITDTSAGVPIITSLRTRNPVSGTAISKADVLASAFSASVSAVIGGTTYTLNARDLLDGTVTPLTDRTNSSGPQFSEFVVGAAVRNGATPHAHLAAYFHLRAYGTAGNVTRVRVTVVMENGWVGVANPGDYTYNLSITVGGASVYTQNALVHFFQARYPKRFWWNGDPQIHVKHDHLYLQDTKMLPKYQVATPSEGTLNGLAQSFAIMAGGNVPDFMAGTGESDHIGPLPRWQALYMVSGDQRAYNCVLANGDAAGSWPVHYRDENTQYPVSIDVRTTLQLGNSSTGWLPPVASVSTLEPDVDHQPSMAYLPYLLTGDYFYLEELQFWNSYNMCLTSPGTRTGQISLQMRGQAWAFRTMGETAAATPDAHAMKSFFVSKVNYYLGTMTTKYVTAPAPADTNNLGAIWAVEDIDSGVGLTNGYWTTWEDAYLTWAIHMCCELGYTGTTLRTWKLKSITGRMGGDEYPWQIATPSQLRMGTGTTWHASWADVAAMKFTAGVLANDVGTQQFADYIMAHYSEISSDSGAEGGSFVPNQMSHYGNQPWGHPSKHQMAVCAAVDAGVDGGMLAWLRMASRAAAPVTDDDPKYALCPRALSRVKATPLAIESPPAYVTAMAANSYRAISTGNGFAGNLQTSQVFAPDVPGSPKTYKPEGCMMDYAGASYDWIHNQLVVGPGGGHSPGGSSTNAMYTFGPLTSSNPQWTLRRGNSTPGYSSGGYYADGRPSATHTYAMQVFDPITQQHLLVGSGAQYLDNGSAANIVPGFRLNPTDGGAYDWDTGHAIIPGLSGNEYVIQGSASAFDDINARAYFKPSAAFGLRRYSPASKTWKMNAGGDGLYHRLDYTMALNPKGRYALSIGGYYDVGDNPPGNEMQFFNIDTGARTAITNITAPDSATFFLPGFKPRIIPKVGFAFHPPSGKFVAYHNGQIWVLTPPSGLSLSAPNASPWVFTIKTPTGDTPGAEESFGTYNRFQWVPALGCFVFVHTCFTNVFVYKPDF